MARKGPQGQWVTSAFVLLPFLSPPPNKPDQDKLVKNLGMCLSDRNLASSASSLQWQGQHWLALAVLLVCVSLRPLIPKNGERRSPPATPHQDSSSSYSLKKRTQDYQMRLMVGPWLTHNWNAIGSSAQTSISSARLHSLLPKKWCRLESNLQGLVPWDGVLMNK